MTNEKLSEIFNYLRPNGGWSFSGIDWEDANYDEGVTPITKNEFETALANYEIWMAEKENNKLLAREALLAKLGITEQELKLLLG